MPQSRLPRPRRVLVIGGGPCGLVTLRNLLERGEFDEVQLVERRDNIGGVWYLDPGPSPNDSTSKSTFDSHSESSTSTTSGAGILTTRPRERERPRWPSPAYPGLVGNVLPAYLSFSGYPFPTPPFAPNLPFATLAETHAYLRSFAQPLLERGVIRLNTEVVAVEELEGGADWRVVVREWAEGGTEPGREVEERWDAVVVAVAWYDNPVYPSTDGLEEARARGLIRHAKWWKGPKAYEGKRVVVVGNGNSSNDIAAQLATVSLTPVYRSIRRPAFPRFVSLPDPNIIDVAPITGYTVTFNQVGPPRLTVSLKDGTSLEDIDYVIAGTGYRTFVPFLRVLDPETRRLTLLTPREDLAYPRVPGLHRQILYAHNPTLAFIGSVMALFVFSLADLSSTWLALAWARRTAYPVTAGGRLEYERGRLAEVRQMRAKTDNPSSLMAYNALGDAELEYTKRLREDVVRIQPDLDAVLAPISDAEWMERESMYVTKLESLRFARDEGSAVGNLLISP